jgi:sugar phosphate isomerase/epimerase
MQLGFVSAVFGDLSLDEVLAFAGNEGYQCVEAMCWPSAKLDRPYGGVCHIDVNNFTQSQADDIGALCEKHQVKLSALGYYANALSDDANEAEVARSHFKKVITAAPLLGLSNANGFIGANRYKPLEDNFASFTQVWPDIIKFAEDRGVRVGIENCPMLMPYTWPFGVNLARPTSVSITTRRIW